MKPNHLQTVSGAGVSSSSLPGATLRLSKQQDRCRSVVESLPEFLTWKAGTNLVDYACEIHEKGIYQRLYSWLRATGEEIADVIMSLPKASQMRLFHAPQFFLLLRSKSPGPEELDRLHNFVAIEEYLCGRKSSVPEGSWSAMGDRYFPADDADSQSPNHDNPLASGRVPLAPYVRGIMIDAWSPYLKSGWVLRRQLGEVQMHTKAEVGRIQECLEQSLSYIESVSPTIARTIQSCVYVIGVANGSDAPHMVSSMSARRMIGSFALSNLLSGEWSPGDVWDAIVHETIHSLIYRLELINPLYTDPAAATEVRGESPWSGRTLELHSLVHACFVWFGLWNFWRLHPHPEPEAARLTSRAESGFLRGDLSSMVSPDACARVRPEVQRAIGQMFDQVKNSVASRTD